MKLNIGDNIRKYRRKAEMTQGQLADRLGTTDQSVSRWENGSTYPDMELLPVIAKLFSTTVDELLGIPDEKKEEAAIEALSKLAQASFEEPVDTGKVVGLIRDIRLNYLGSEHFYDFWLSVRNSVYRMPEVLPEVRLTFDAIIDGDFNIWKKNEAIVYMTKIEDDEHIDKFIEQYACERDLTKNALLSERYAFRNERDKYEPIRQLFLQEQIDRMIGTRSLWVKSENLIETEDMLPLLLARNTLQLNLLHAFNNQIPDSLHPISANGEVDFWVYERTFDIGLRRVGCLASSGDADGAFIVLEDIVSLLEKAMKITSPVTLRCSSPWIDKTEYTAEEGWSPAFGSWALATEEEHDIWIHNYYGFTYVLYPSWYYDVLTNPTGNAYTQEWHWLDPIRNDPRYQGYVDRVKALIVTRPKSK